MGKSRGQVAEQVGLRQPKLARAEAIDKVTRSRVEVEVDAALKRRPTTENKLGGALRALAPHSPHLRGLLVDALTTMLRRRTTKRELYAASLRALAETHDKRTPALLADALTAEEAGGTPALSAACFCRDASLAQPLAKLAASRQSHLAFGAETARVVRDESNGARLGALAPMIKESHRIALCGEIFVPLARNAPVSRDIAPALKVLRGAERHLGRWLVLAEVAAKAGDPGPAEEAREKSTVGPTSARAAWSLVTWALAEATRGAGDVLAPTTRPTVELIARLSDRPSADRDTTFLFRMASAGASVCRPMLEGLVKEVPLADEVSVRASLFLAKDHGREDLMKALVEAATQAKREELRGLAAAALFDAGARDKAREIAGELVTSRVIGNVAWSALIRANAGASPVLTERAFRWIQWGWLE